MQTNSDLMKIAQNIRLLILDVDGVLTDGSIMMSSSGEDIKSFCCHDGYGIYALQQAGIPVAIISGRKSQAVSLRMQELNVSQIYQGQKDKDQAFKELLQHYHVTPEQVAYVGDDTPDLTVMKQVALPIAVSNAVAEVKQSTPWHTGKSGGKGAVREVCNLLLEAITANANKEYCRD